MSVVIVVARVEEAAGGELGHELGHERGGDVARAVVLLFLGGVVRPGGVGGGSRAASIVAKGEITKRGM